MALPVRHGADRGMNPPPQLDVTISGPKSFAL